MVVLLGVLLLAAGAHAAPAQPGEAAPADAARQEEAPPPPDPKAEAAAHFKLGRELYRNGAFAAALAEFHEARRLYPTWSATSSAAICLRKLQREDEAIETFELLLQDFQGSMPPEAKTAAQQHVVELRKLTGTITIDAAEVGATVVIDGRYRGEHPSPVPLHVIAGTHLVRVYKERFKPFEGSVHVAPGQTAIVSARLEALSQSGLLRVAERAGRALEVIVDGIPVGVTPWEGPLEVGEHAVTLRGKDSLGTLPSKVTVRLNQRTDLNLAAEDLTASIKISPEPVTASVAIDGLFVGRGIFEGRLRPGEHEVKLVADGYLAETRRVNVEGGAQQIVTIKLRRDPNSPLWQRPGHFMVELGAGLALTPALGGAISAGCEGSCSQGIGLGGMLDFHGGYELSGGFGFGLKAGYWRISQDTEGRPTAVHAVGRVAPDLGAANDTIEHRGFLIGAFGALRLGERFPVRLRLGAGVAFGSVVDTRTGEFRVSDPRSRDSYRLGPVIEAPSVVWLVVDPDVRIGMRFSEHIELSAGVSMPIFVAPSTPTWNADHAINAFSDGYGTFEADALTNSIVYAIAPGLSARYDF
jgi:tetratricopeptide (TPR) repeat protein